MTSAPPPVLDEYCDPVDLKKHPVASDEADLRGAYVPNHSLDDDYSVPYEVKKIMSGKQLCCCVTFELENRRFTL